MGTKRKRAEVSDDENEADPLLYVKQSILSVCNLGTEDPPGRPPFDVLKSRIQRAYHAEEAAELVSFVAEREGDEAAFWAELDAANPEREPPPPLDAGVAAHIRLLARVETERHMATRMLLREKKQSQKEAKQKRVHLFDSNGSVEKALEMIEALPQGSRGVQAAHTGFFKLGREVAGEGASPERKIEIGLLLEEYALELLQPHMEAAGEVPGRTASPLMDVTGNASCADVSRREGQAATRMLEALGVLEGTGYLRGEGCSGKGRSAKQDGQDAAADMSSDEYST